MRRLWILLVITMFVLACQTANSLSVPTIVPTEVPTPLPTDVFVLPTVTPTVQTVVGSDMWYIRTGPGEDYPPLEEFAVAGDTFTVYGNVRGWARIGDGLYICSRAFFPEEKCE